jgi:hypothetical protein
MSAPVTKDSIFQAWWLIGHMWPIRDMMRSGPPKVMSSDSSLTLVIVGVIIFIMIIRMRKVINGTKASTLSATLYSSWYVVFGVALVLGSYYAGVPPAVFIIYTAVAELSMLFAYRHSNRSLVFWRTAREEIYFKGGLVIMVICIVAFTIGVAFAYFFLGIQYLFYYGGPGGTVELSAPTLLAIVASDLLVMVGRGLRLGRNVQTLRIFRLIKAGHEEYLSSDDAGWTCGCWLPHIT